MDKDIISRSDYNYILRKVHDTILLIAIRFTGSDFRSKCDIIYERINHIIRKYSDVVSKIVSHSVFGDPEFIVSLTVSDIYSINVEIGEAELFSSKSISPIQIGLAPIVMVLLLFGFDPSNIVNSQSKDIEYDAISQEYCTHLINSYESIGYTELEFICKHLSFEYMMQLIEYISQFYKLGSSFVANLVDSLEDEDIEKKMYLIRYLHDHYSSSQQIRRFEL